MVVLAILSNGVARETMNAARLKTAQYASYFPAKVRLLSSQSDVFFLKHQSDRGDSGNKKTRRPSDQKVHTSREAREV